MACHFGDLSHAQHNTNEPRFVVWDADLSHHMQPYTRQPEFLVAEDDTMYSGFDNDRVSMQRFMLEQSPLSSGLLNANIPTYNQFQTRYEEPWPPVNCIRDVSPDCTSASGNSSHAPQTDLRSSNYFIQFDGPIELSQSLVSPVTSEYFNGGGCRPEVHAIDGSISLRELEYNHHESEILINDVDFGEMNLASVYCHDHDIVKAETTWGYKCAVSGIGSSVRDAESVQPIEMEDEPSSDSDYSPLSNQAIKRRQYSFTNNKAVRSRRRRHSRKDSLVSNASSPTRAMKKHRGPSNASRGNSQPSDRQSFPCPLASYGCSSQFSSKNEWKRHISTQHFKLGYWRCDLCPLIDGPSCEQGAYHNDFNRKDLFTQHLRRMHSAPASTKQIVRKEYPVTEDNLQQHRDRCYRILRTAPRQSICLFCDRTFKGAQSWEERVEHVGRHLEKDYKSGNEMLMPSTWPVDLELERYLEEEGLVVKENGEWKLGDGRPRRPALDEDHCDSEVE